MDCPGQFADVHLADDPAQCVGQYLVSVRLGLLLNVLRQVNQLVLDFDGFARLDNLKAHSTVDGAAFCVGERLHEILGGRHDFVVLVIFGLETGLSKACRDATSFAPSIFLH
jgi:hypothetical protein